MAGPCSHIPVVDVYFPSFYSSPSIPFLELNEHSLLGGCFCTFVYLFLGALGPLVSTDQSSKTAERLELPLLFVFVLLSRPFCTSHTTAFLPYGVQIYSCKEPLRDADNLESIDCRARNTSASQHTRDRFLFELRLNRKRPYLISIVDYRSLSSMGSCFEFWPRYQALTAMLLCHWFGSGFFFDSFLSKKYPTYLLPVPLHQCLSLVIHLCHVDSDHLDTDCMTEALYILPEIQMRKNRLDKHFIRRLCHGTSSKRLHLSILLCGRHQHQRIQLFWIHYVTSSYLVAKISRKVLKQIPLERSRDDKSN